MALIEGWLVLTPKKHVYFYSEKPDLDRTVLELPWHELEDEKHLVTFLDDFNVDVSDVTEGAKSSCHCELPVKEMTELKVVAEQQKLTAWFEENSN